MTEHPTITVIRQQGHLTGDSGGFRALLTAYHLRTEAEKDTRAEGAMRLPERYRAESQDPGAAFAGGVVFLALDGSATVGCVIVTAPADGHSEIKRLWTDPAHRGRGVASALVHEALSHCADSGITTVRLSVWRWRTAAITLYERFGFRVTASWDPREGLICMEHIGLVEQEAPAAGEGQPPRIG